MIRKSQHDTSPAFPTARSKDNGKYELQWKLELELCNISLIVIPSRIQKPNAELLSTRRCLHSAVHAHGNAGGNTGAVPQLFRKPSPASYRKQRNNKEKIFDTMFRMHEDHVNAEDGRSDDVDDERTPAFLKDFKK